MRVTLSEITMPDSGVKENGFNHGMRENAHAEKSACCPWSPVSSRTSIKSFGRPDAFLFRKRASKPMNFSFLPRYSDCTAV